ncbi:Peptidylprolyl isomerase [Saliniradius amylolyticus]|uniref:Peptidyl-prolyl cis-trans isomerase n=1 Tax=Saliniradius amylolyticus TaxID=2183582 RepID=A0A2S2DZ42_9ALTE|nr:FKBP-type peptidyl-prolyl cis-trans isomerase [Saliniradius amylolyticus]AWL10664.1 Peptidylprolyl isomerase [Saliniradius amylolyticus]
MSKYESVEARASYGIGLNMGEQLASNPFDGLDIDAVTAGIATAFNKEPSEVAPEDLQAAFEEIQKRMQAQKEEEAKAQIQAGVDFLKENGARDEVTVTDTGLQYEVLAEGEGESPTAEDKVKVHYHGTFIDGQVFDSSVQRGEPVEFPANGVIAGWTEALQLMKPGSKFKLAVPHQLAYGEQGAGGAIPPYTTLCFEVELLEVVK